MKSDMVEDRIEMEGKTLKKMMWDMSACRCRYTHLKFINRSDFGYNIVLLTKPFSFISFSLTLFSNLFLLFVSNIFYPLLTVTHFFLRFSDKQNIYLRIIHLSIEEKEQMWNIQCCAHTKLHARSNKRPSFLFFPFFFCSSTEKLVWKCFV